VNKRLQNELEQMKITLKEPKEDLDQMKHQLSKKLVYGFVGLVILLGLVLVAILAR
jgi:hypothetical protein